MPSTLLETPESHTQPTMVQAHEENMFRQAWHSIEEALHFREPVPPPVPPKDEKWLVKTVDLALPQEEADASFWDKIIQRITSSQNNNEEQDAVSLNVPAEAALNQLGVQSNDGDIQGKKDYFKRMATRVQEKFDHDKEQPNSNADVSPIVIPVAKEEDSQSTTSSRRHHRHHHIRHYMHALHMHFHPHHNQEEAQQQLQRQQSYLMPKVDPKEMKTAYNIIYHNGKSTDDDDEDRKLFGSWWGCHSKGSKEDKEANELLESEWEIVDAPKNKKEKRQSLGEHNGSTSAADLSTGSGFTWWKKQSVDAKRLSITDKHDQGNDRKATTKRHQAIASAAAYEAVKEYQARKIRQGKKVSHGEMKAILAGMAMAEAVKILESRHSDDDDDEDKNETVAEAGSAALKLFELLR